jgi:ribosomal protein S21
MRVRDREPIRLALKRFKKLLKENGIRWSRHGCRWFVKPSQLRRHKRFLKELKARQQTFLAKRAGLQ